MTMTDKIIIDGVDVTKCFHRATNKVGNDIGTYCREFTGSCKGQGCYYKQLQRKEQECEKEKQNAQYTYEMYQALKESYNILLKEKEEKEQECKELRKDRKYLYNFLTNKYNYDSFKPMWGAYLLKHFFNENLGDFFDTKTYEMADTIAEKDKGINRYKQALEKIEEIAKNLEQTKIPFCTVSEQIQDIINEVLKDE